MLNLQNAIKYNVEFTKCHQTQCWIYKTPSNTMLNLQHAIKHNVEFTKRHQTQCWIYKMPSNTMAIFKTPSNTMLNLQNAIKHNVEYTKRHQTQCRFLKSKNRRFINCDCFVSQPHKYWRKREKGGEWGIQRERER